MTPASPAVPATGPTEPGPPARNGSTAPAPGALGATVAVLGSIISIDVDRPAWAVRLRALMAPFLLDEGAPARSPTSTYAIHADGENAVLVADGAELLRAPWPSVEARLLVEVNATALAGYAGLAVHAGVVARGGDVICFPGESGLGKSTMTAACLGAGLDYVSDEALCIDRGTGAVVAYPRPIALSRTSTALLGLTPGDAPAPGREVLVLPEALGSRPVPPGRELRLAHVIDLRRGATEVHLEPLHRSLAVPALLSMAFNHFKDPDASVAVVGALARDVRMWRLHHDDPCEAADLVARTFA